MLYGNITSTKAEMAVLTHETLFRQKFNEVQSIQDRVETQ